MATERPPTIDPRAAARWAHSAPAESPWLHEEVARRMQERLGWITVQPAAWADWGGVRGGLQGHALVAQRFPNAACYLVETAPVRAQIALDALARPWWQPSRWRAGRTLAATPPDGGVQMVWANMALHLDADPQALIAQWHRALAVDGFLMFSCLGPDTAIEVRRLYAEQGWPAPAHEFTDMHDWGDMLVHAGFAEPVMDVERITLTYESAERMLRELRELGRNLHPARFPALRGRAWRQRLLDALTRRAKADVLPLTIEIIYGHAFKPTPKLRVSPQSTLALDDMRSMLRQGPSAQRNVPKNTPPP